MTVTDKGAIQNYKIGNDIDLLWANPSNPTLLRINSRINSLLLLDLVISLLHGMPLGPLFGGGDSGLFAGFPRFGHVVGKRVVGVRSGEQRLDGQQYCPDL